MRPSLPKPPVVSVPVPVSLSQQPHTLKPGSILVEILEKLLTLQERKGLSFPAKASAFPCPVPSSFLAAPATAVSRYLDFDCLIG
ncbi:hypothetical protein D8674_037638 [Pyrus ussuriensis x Pyrus communis]|uniref:Uncharacterized protein n=1 Tax=Pyrus ussuriensis x Pyrus communis TaxID=2448454 RepID=A0A5N5H1F5_9ROSA|nr:hypothetical protein D8674_037638 [Pyrus ussuriensis x Pyrus communis]